MKENMKGAILARKLARELTQEELGRISGGLTDITEDHKDGTSALGTTTGSETGGDFDSRKDF